MTEAKFGEWSPVKQVTREDQIFHISFKVSPIIEKMAGTNFKVYLPTVYSSQSLAGGTNYMVKVLVDTGGDGVSVDALICKPLYMSSEVEPIVEEIKYPKPFYDPLIPFEHKK